MPGSLVFCGPFRCADLAWMQTRKHLVTLRENLPSHGCAVNPEALHRALSPEASSAESGGSQLVRWI
eukprot:5195535-Alexandrium_andersonii.AAC.1